MVFYINYSHSIITRVGKVKMVEMLLTIATTVLSGAALIVLKHIMKKIDRSSNRHRLMEYKHDALIDTLSTQYGNGKFKQTFQDNLNQLMKEDDFVYKE